MVIINFKGLLHVRNFAITITLTIIIATVVITKVLTNYSSSQIVITVIAVESFIIVAFIVVINTITIIANFGITQVY